MMKIKKIFNNNAVIANDSKNQESVLFGCGLAFKKKIGDNVDTDKIEKTFILKEDETTNRLKTLLGNVTAECIELSFDIIEYAKSNLNIKLNDYIYVTLTDHLNFALKLYDDGLNNPNMLMWEIKRFYPKEFKIGLKALEYIEEITGKKLREDEAGHIALHLINAQINNKFNKTEDLLEVTKMISDILNIVKYSYKKELNEKSYDYERFVIHLRFFLMRLKNNENSKILDDDFLLKQVKNKLQKAYNCMLNIQEYLETVLSDDEKLYLTLHIQRVTQE